MTSRALLRSCRLIVVYLIFFSIPDSIGEDALKEASGIFPLSGAYVRKVKVLKKPKVDSKLIFTYIKTPFQSAD